MPRVPRGGGAPNQRPRARTPIGVRDLPAPAQTSHARRASIPPGRSGDSTCPAGAGHGHESSTGRLAHLPHLMRMVEACSAPAVRGAAFFRPHCGPRITKIHSAAACAAPTQSSSATLIGYDGTTLFHHATYAASYTAVQLRGRRRRWLRPAPFRQDSTWTHRTEDSGSRQRNPGGRSPSPATLNV